MRDGSGALTGATEYDAYGKEPYQAGPTDRGDFRYAGKHGCLDDDAFGWQMMGARFYLPAIGKFLNQDPIGQAGGLNLYAYCGDSPLSRVDPSGKSSWAGVSNAVQLAVPFLSTYATQDQAVYAAARYIWPVSWGSHREYGGWVVQHADKSYALRALYVSPAGQEGSVDATSDVFGSVAFWHTHPFLQGMPYPGEPGKTVGDPNVFSRPGHAGYGGNGDIPFFNFWRRDGYLISPLLIRRFDYATKAEPIVTYNLDYLFGGRKDAWAP